MKILEVVFSLGIGGTERTAVNFAIGLAQKGCEVVVFALADGIRKKELHNQHIKVLVGWDEFNRYAQSYPPPFVIHFHNHGIDSEAQKKVCAFFPNALICEQNVFGVPSAYERLDCSFQLSKWCEWNYLNRRQPTRCSIRILPNPTNADNFFPADQRECEDFRRKYNIPLDAIVLLRVGQPFVAKWNNTLIDLFIDLRKKYKDLYLLCVGAPQSLIDYAQKKHVTSNIQFIDRLSNDTDLRVCYSSCDVFLHLARIGESFGIVMLEAMLCGLPVVTVNTPYCDNAQSEVVGHGIGGLVANRYKGIYKAVCMLLDDKQYYRYISRKGREYAISRYELSNVSDTFLRYMNEESRIDNSATINVNEIKAYLSNAVDKPIPLAAHIFIAKRFCLRFISERLYRYLFRCYCRLFDKSVQL